MVDWERWNPLTDDGDALRLACPCLCQSRPAQLRRAQTQLLARYAASFQESTIDELDTAAAVRRAIVRAAAEIGRVHHDLVGHRRHERHPVHPVVLVGNWKHAPWRTSTGDLADRETMPLRISAQASRPGLWIAQGGAL